MSANPLFLRHFENRDWWAAPIRWVSYKVQRRTPCHECLARLHESGGVGARPAQARHRRVCGNTEVLLCPEDALAWQDEQKRRKKAA